MRSSYLSKLEYSDIFKSVLFDKKINNVLEIGILDGYSLELISNVTKANINAYDIFEEFEGNSANKDYLLEKFKDYKNVNIEYGDFYQLHTIINDNSLDLIHIDIANNGDVYEYVFQNYMEKLTNDGTLILEGGSIERDNVEWMIKYDKPKIQPILDNYKDQYHIITIGSVPSITIVRKKN